MVANNKLLKGLMTPEKVVEIRALLADIKDAKDVCFRLEQATKKKVAQRQLLDESEATLQGLLTQFPVQ